MPPKIATNHPVKCTVLGAQINAQPSRLLMTCSGKLVIAVLIFGTGIGLSMADQYNFTLTHSIQLTRFAGFANRLEMTRIRNSPWRKFGYACRVWHLF